MSKIMEYVELKQFHRRILVQLNNFVDYKQIEFVEAQDSPMVRMMPTIYPFDEATKHLYKLIADILDTPEINRIIHDRINQILTEQLEKARLEAQKEMKEILAEKEG